MDFTRLVRGAGIVLVLVGASGVATGAPRLAETVAGADVDVGDSGESVLLNFTTLEPVSGFGLTCLWTGVVVDNEDGVAPWSLDLIVDPFAPGAETVNWNPVGGDVTISDYPLADFTEGLGGVNGNGAWTIELSSVVGAPYVFGLRDVEWHVFTEVPDVVVEWQGTTATGDGQWDRPYFIAGVSSLGPTNYRVVSFQVSESGGYEFTSVVTSGNNFTFLYKDAFDPNAPLANLLDYGLGNGNAPNGSPQGTSFISAVLHTGTTYYFVNSQWASSPAGTPYENTVVGPGSLIQVSPPFPCVGDLDGDFDTDVFDFNIFAPAYGSTGLAPFTGGDLDGDGDVDVFDFNIFAPAFGCSVSR